MKSGRALNAPAVPHVGEVIRGKYELTRQLGRGGMGVVFEAINRGTGRRFALKWLVPELANSREGRRRFIREARATSRLQDPAVVDVYDIDEDGGSIFIVMELLVGESLESRIQAMGCLPPSEAVALLLPCIQAIGRAHALGIVHRDLKPANLFVCRATEARPECVKVLDFGVSRVLGESINPEWSLTQSGALLGTPHYMAPEQMEGVAVDHRADIYAFGVVLYEVLSGARPFAASSLAQLVLRARTEQPTPLHEIVSAVNGTLSAAVQKALATSAVDRFQSMDELAQALEAGLATTRDDVRVRGYAKAASRTGWRPMCTAPKWRKALRSWLVWAAIVAAVACAVLILRAASSVTVGGTGRLERAPARVSGAASSSAQSSPSAPSADIPSGVLSPLRDDPVPHGIDVSMLPEPTEHVSAPAAALSGTRVQAARAPDRPEKIERKRAARPRQRRTSELVVPRDPKASPSETSEQISLTIDDFL